MPTMTAGPRPGAPVHHHEPTAPGTANKHRDKLETYTIDDKPPEPMPFRRELPQYDSSPSNAMPLLFGILRRIYLLLKIFGILK